MRLERYIEVKKLLFVHNIMSLEDHEPVKIVFRERSIFLIDNLEDFRDNQFRSPVLDFILTAEIFLIPLDCWSQMNGMFQNLCGKELFGRVRGILRKYIGPSK